MMEEKNFEEKFTTIVKDGTLPFPEQGDIVNDGDNRLLVCTVEKVDGKDYVLFYNEKIMKLGLYEISGTVDGFSYTLVNDDIIFGKLIMNIVKKHDYEGEE